MVGNQKTKQLDGGQTRDHCSHPGLLPSFPPSSYCMWCHCEAWTGFQLITSLIKLHYFSTTGSWRCSSSAANMLEDNFMLCNKVLSKMSVLIFCSSVLSCNTLTPGECYLTRDVFPWRQVMNVLIWAVWVSSAFLTWLISLRKNWSFHNKGRIIYSCMFKYHHLSY